MAAPVLGAKYLAVTDTVIKEGEIASIIKAQQNYEI